MTTRLVAAAVVAALSAAYVLMVALRDPGYVSDFDQIWLGARALLSGENAYRAVASGFAGTPALPFPLFYPLPAVVAGVPFALMPLIAGRMVFAAASMGVLAYLLAGRGVWALAALLSAPAFQSVALVQWSTWLACAVLVPWFGWAIACKPNAGLAVLCAARSTRAALISIAASATLVIVAFAVQPGWVADWVAALRGQPHFRPYILRPGGVLLLLALLRWRRPEARWLAVVACTPGTPGLQEALVFFTTRLTLRQVLVLGLLSHAALWVAFVARQHGSFYSSVPVAAVANIAFIYIPALVVVLQRPNEGDVPAAIDRVIAKLARRPSNG
jgi:hypothetical protein